MPREATSTQSRSAAYPDDMAQEGSANTPKRSRHTVHFAITCSEAGSIRFTIRIGDDHTNGRRRLADGVIESNRPQQASHLLVEVAGVQITAFSLLLGEELGERESGALGHKRRGPALISSPSAGRVPYGFLIPGESGESTTLGTRG